MDKIKSLTNYFSIVLIFMSPGIIADDVCVKKGPCTCEFPNGTGIDLTPAHKSTFYEAQMYQNKNKGTQVELSTYYYYPCIDVQPQFNMTTNDTCGMPLSICRHVNKLDLDAKANAYVMDKGIYEFMGTSNVTQFSADGKSILYFNGPSSTLVLLVCAETDNVLQVYSLEEPNKVVLSFYSRDACLKQIEPSGRSLGSTLLIILFVLILFYLILGICTKKFLMGATGIEVVPNLTFWSDLPNLVKDGWTFAVNGFKVPHTGAGATISPDPNSYDSI